MQILGYLIACFCILRTLGTEGGTPDLPGKLGGLPGFAAGTRFPLWPLTAK